MNSFPMSGGFDRPQGSHENMLNSQATLALDVSTIIITLCLCIVM